MEETRMRSIYVFLRRFELALYLFSVSAVLPLHGQPVADPCSGAIRIGKTERSTAFIPGLEDPHLCDSNIQPNTWYRFDGFNSGENKMPESCVEEGHCGTHSAVWMRGSHPTEQNPGPVEVDACAMTTSDECCGWTAKMKVKWCGTFYAYALPNVQDCHRAFCFGNTYPCPSGHHWEEDVKACVRTPYPVMTIPRLSDPFISAWKIVNGRTATTQVNATTFSVKCTVGYQPKAADDGARFEVSFHTDEGFTIYNVTLLSTYVMVVTLGEDRLANHLGKTLTCQVVSYFASHPTRKSAALVSNGYWFGIKPKSDNHDFNRHVIIREGQQLRFYLEATFPITLGWCYNQPTNSACSQLKYTFYVTSMDSKGVTSSKCDFRLAPGEDTKKKKVPTATLR